MSKLQQIVALCEAGERAPIISARTGVRLDEIYVVRRLVGIEPPLRRRRERRARVMPSPHPVKTPGDFLMKPTIRETCIANRDHFTADQIAARLGVTKGVVIGHWYRARAQTSVVIEAVQWTGTNRVEIARFILPPDNFSIDHPLLYPGDAIFIDTLEGRMRADIGDWIIRGVKGEIYIHQGDDVARVG